MGMHARASEDEKARGTAGFLERLEDAYWGKRAVEAVEEGLASPEETEAVLRSILHEAD